MKTVTFKGAVLNLIGRELNVGEYAPEFTVVGRDMNEVSLGDFSGKNLLISAVTSLDTSICDEQTRRFNEEAAKLGNVELITISMDLPFAQSRFCESKSVGTRVCSDHRNASFGLNYGVLIREWRLLARSLFLVDKNRKVVYKEIVPEIASHPNYEKVLEEVKKLE